jgi:tetratricopeptide (TPR) repeat protein
MIQKTKEKKNIKQIVAFGIDIILIISIIFLIIFINAIFEHFFGAVLFFIFLTFLASLSMLIGYRKSDSHELIEKNLKNQIKFYDQILDQNACEINVLNKKGKILMRLKRYQEALEVFNKVLQLDPTNSEALSYKIIAINNIKYYSKNSNHRINDKF